MSEFEEQLKEFLVDSDHYVAEVAHEVEGVMYDYETGAINEAMKKELLNDVLELAQVNAQAESLDTKIKVEKLVDVVKVIAGLIA